MTSTATLAPAAADLVIGETFSHTLAGSRGFTHYDMALVTYVHEDGTEEPAGVLVAGEAHSLCRRCGLGLGHYSFNGEDDICYECNGAAHGTARSLASLKSLARARVLADKRVARKEAQARALADALLAEWKGANADLVPVLAAALPPEWKVATSFLAKMAERLLTYGEPLTEGQTAAVRKIVADNAAKVVVECPEGRIVIEGKVIGLKSVEDNFSYYGGTILKMTVEDDRGFRVFGTMPSTLSDALYDAWLAAEQADAGNDFSHSNYGADVWQAFAKGSRVRFTATVTRSDRDADFGFAKRPAKAEVLPAAE